MRLKVASQRNRETTHTRFAAGERCPAGTRFGRLRITSCTLTLGPTRSAPRRLQRPAFAPDHEAASSRPRREARAPRWHDARRSGRLFFRNGITVTAYPRWFLPSAALKPSATRTPPGLRGLTAPLGKNTSLGCLNEGMSGRTRSWISRSLTDYLVIVDRGCALRG
jgi:hypothetical protein